MKIQIRIMTLTAILGGAFCTQAADVELTPAAKSAREQAQQLLKDWNDARPKAEAAAQKIRDEGRRPEVLGLEKAKALRDEEAVTAYERYVKTAKEMEVLINRQIGVGQQPTIAAAIARFERLQAEVDLARIKGWLPTQEASETTPARQRALVALRAEQMKVDAGKSTLFHVLQAAKELRNTEVQISADSEQRIAAHQRCVTLVRQLKNETDRRIESGIQAPFEGRLAAEELKEAETQLQDAIRNK